jgi:hypothetical protein
MSSVIGFQDLSPWPRFLIGEGENVFNFATLLFVRRRIGGSGVYKLEE